VIGVDLGEDHAERMHARLLQALHRRLGLRLARLARLDHEDRVLHLVAEHDRVGDAEHRRAVDDHVREVLLALRRAGSAA
jgi:hypothetical protein